MNVPNTTPAESHGRDATDDMGAAVPAGRCPVDHAAGSTSPEAAPNPRAAIPVTALRGPRLPAMVQVFIYWKRPAAFLEWCRRRYGNRFVLSRGIPPRLLYVLTDPEDMKQLFLAPPDVLHTGHSSAASEKFTGQSGLAWLDENEHKVRRKQLMPSTHGKALERIEASITEMAKQDVATWPRGEIRALHPLLHRYTLNVIREVIFGPAPPRRWEELFDVLSKMLKFNDRMASTMLIHRMSPATVRLLTAIRPTGLHDFLKLRDRADALIAEAIEERRNSGVRGDDMLFLLLGITHDDGSPLDAAEMRDEMMTIFIAGTETTAAALSWAFLYLSRDQAVRERLVAEIDAGESDAYLTATVQEVLRLRPSIPQLIAREVMKPIEIGGVRYEPGMLLWASAYLLHRNPSLYPDPYAFGSARDWRRCGVAPS